MNNYNCIRARNAEFFERSGGIGFKSLVVPIASWPSSSSAHTNADIAVQPQSNVQHVAAAPHSGHFEGIVATAQRIEGRLEDVPTAATALSGGNLNRNDIPNSEPREQKPYRRPDARVNFQPAERPSSIALSGRNLTGVTVKNFAAVANGVGFPIIRIAERSFTHGLDLAVKF